MMSLREHLRAYQVAENVPHNRRFTDFTVSLLGGQPAPQGCTMKTKAAETLDLLRWAHNLLQHHASVVPGAGVLLAASSALLEFFRLCKDADDVCSPALQQQFFDAALRCLLAMQRAGIDDVPKHHMFLHLAARTAYIVTMATGRCSRF